MSGHSKWATIHRKKGLLDAARGKVFQKLAKEIMVAAKSGSPDPNQNSSLRLAVDKAKAQNMPKENIQKAIEKASQMLESNESYVADYVGGTISVVCNETGETIWEKNIGKTEIEKTVEGFENAIISENAVSWFVDLRTGLGEAEYLKADFTLEEALEDQVNMNIE